MKKNKKKTIMVIILTIIVFALVILPRIFAPGKKVPNPVNAVTRPTYRVDPETYGIEYTFYSDQQTVYYMNKELEDSAKDNLSIPKEINMDNFVAYISNEGSSSWNTYYCVKKEDDKLVIYRDYFDCGDTEVHTGEIANTDVFFADMEALSPTAIFENHNAGGNNEEAYLLYLENGKIMKCSVNNILPERRDKIGN
ncbi:hypothetical protein [Butyrivibrio proteoclasticus]|uniref:hypothetical protein n=1 Tax=Butyrivibrio proteoclasticus TaxID=43305 RepID=UPI0004797DAD|nr:hypothetical protein [Butyrivibrio proteoclasticus]